MAPTSAQVAVLVGTALDPYRLSRILPEGVEVYTLWGEMAYQLGGFQGHQLVAEVDAGGAAPGANSLVELFRKVGPCVILIDELVAFIRNIKGARGKPRAGDFNSNLTFIQNLTEAVKRVPTALLVASIVVVWIKVKNKQRERTKSCYPVTVHGLFKLNRHNKIVHNTKIILNRILL
ncbi:MAG: DUF499 domain-containing protein [Chloroflexi bacterium]|nr:DUF499 domain-containing protein [Chloroflexota bacterium]